ncbi:SLBB domain-containing protein [Shewanella sp. FJAT-52076]|nr:SLBB domain-containing protein [Shewanella sp. FJAT-52076]
MIEQFKRLPKSEQERIARQYGIDPALLSGERKGTADSFDNPNLIRSRDGQRLNSAFDDEEFNLQSKKKSTFSFTEDASKQELKRFGYDLFEGEPSTFAPVSDVPVPSEYPLGPGDSLKIQLFGKENKQLSLMVTRDGTIQFPDIGPIVVAGMAFDEARKAILEHIQNSMIGVQASITMGELRSIRIFIAGDAYKPGSYTVSSLATITQSLFVSGGVSEIGSLRNIQLKRNGKLIGSLDLYDLLLKGDASNDLRLQSGDVVFIPAAGGLISIDGEVRRPAIYEVKKGETIGDVVNMAAGLLPGAFPKSSMVERYAKTGVKTVLNLDLTSAKGLNESAQAGDFIKVRSATAQFDTAITVVGAVVRPGKYQWFEGQRINNVLGSVWRDLQISTDLDYALVVREKDVYGNVEVHQFNLGQAINNPNSLSNLRLNARDKIFVFNYSDDGLNRFELNRLVKDRVAKISELTGASLVGSDLFGAGFSDLNRKKLVERTELAGVVVTEVSEDTDEDKQAQQELVTAEVSKMLLNIYEDQELIKHSHVMTRTELLYPLISRLKAQSRNGETAQLVFVNGQVRFEGTYPLPVEGTVKSLIAAAGGLAEGAYTGRAELTRTLTSDNGSEITHLSVELAAAVSGDNSANLLLEGRDVLTVMTTPDWQEHQTVEIRGEVKFPGIYNIRRGETLKDVVARAGGFTEYAYLPSAVFVRESVRKQEQLEIKKLADQLRRDIATRGVSKDGNIVNYADARMMLKDLENIKAVGRLVVDLPAISMGIDQADLQLENEDILYVPTTKQTVAVMGEVQHAATHRFKDGLTIEQYVAMSGGERKRADDDRTYVIKANGSVMIPKGTFWFSSEDQLMPGDTIIVPLDTEYKDNLTLWSQVTQIIYNTAVAISAISGL